MHSKYEKIVKILSEKGRKISTMESCTGGSLAGMITNISGSSDVFCFGAVTYSNEFKIKMGVDSKVIDKYSVYSMETAKEMSYHICEFAMSDYGVGITGKLNRADKANMYGMDNMVYISIYDKEKDLYYTASVEVEDKDRIYNKELVLDGVANLLLLYL